VQDDPYQIPKFDLNRTDLDFMEELKGVHSEFQDCFSRQEPRDNFYQYMAGQMSPLERKSIEPIAIAVESAKVRTVQFFVSDVVWNDGLISLVAWIQEKNHRAYLSHRKKKPRLNIECDNFLKLLIMYLPTFQLYLPGRCIITNSLMNRQNLFRGPLPEVVV
jgi:hypothetical protein